ncbi:type VI secretion system secreted protein Hcp [Erwinia persicina]|jgi:type VI secretion system secreted protein Hcp|uniref:Hcp family type VI secretion system effector n=1 Tax=Erwinia aeris TaxID=3239803 RepID=A0ABV4E5B6_9GAMM|nr:MULTISPECIES: type VI secretion system tube protein Hcp [Erwinia]MCP1438590.1 type VI secretion system secreted protein Hcp [Erwinia persicina]MDN4627770.1 type VI secretion system tube protein Hcp [Erwinia sp. PsM31]
MAQDIFIKFNGIEGESQDSTHKGETEILSWEWSVRQASNMHLGWGGGAGKCTVDDLYFEHYIDKTSTNLLHYCLTGKRIPEAVLTVRKAGGSPLEYMHITLQDIIITGVNPVYLNTMRVPREAVSLAFSRIKMDYVLRNAGRNIAGTVSMGYDIKANTDI